MSGTRLSPEIEETIDAAREYAQDGIGDAGVLAGDFAQAVVQLADACVIGLPCEKHGNAVHGQEAEELRAGLEKILKEYGSTPDDVPYKHDDYEELRLALHRLLDDVDARDSLGFLEAADEDDQVVSL